MILTHESGSQEDQFDEKNGGKKSRGTIPLNLPNSFITFIIIPDNYLRFRVI
jgi:hypothetical protein